MIKGRRVENTELGDVAVSSLIIGGCLLAIGAVIKTAIDTPELHLLEIGLGTALVTVASLGIVAVVYRLMQYESAFM